MKLFILSLMICSASFADFDYACSNFCQTEHPDSIAYRIVGNACTCLYEPNTSSTTPYEYSGEQYGEGTIRSEKEIDPSLDGEKKND